MAAAYARQQNSSQPWAWWHGSCCQHRLLAIGDPRRTLPFLTLEHALPIELREHGSLTL